MAIGKVSLQFTKKNKYMESLNIIIPAGYVGINSRINNLIIILIKHTHFYAHNLICQSLYKNLDNNEYRIYFEKKIKECGLTIFEEDNS